MNKTIEDLKKQFIDREMSPATLQLVMDAIDKAYEIGIDSGYI
jgi:hypothetical protein